MNPHLTRAIVAKINALDVALRPDHLEGWTGRPFGDALLNEIALGIAAAYQDGTLPFAEADAAMGELSGLLMRRISDGDAPEGRLPYPFWDIYEAFDAGEYPHEDGGDPEPGFTRPMLAAILAAARGR